MEQQDMEILTGKIYIDDISELVNLVSTNKVKLNKVIFDRNDGYWTFEIQNYDSNETKKLLGVIDGFIKKTLKKEGKKNHLKREKNGQITDEVDYI